MDASLVVLIPILLTIEGSNRAVVPPGDGGAAIGPLQIHKIYVDDVNTILGYNKYSYEDRNDRQKSIEMAKIYISHYTPKGIRGTLLDKLIVMGRIHNGGPKGYKKKSTLPYKKKIIKYYKERRK